MKKILISMFITITLLFTFETTSYTTSINAIQKEANAENAPNDISHNIYMAVEDCKIWDSKKAIYDVGQINCDEIFYGDDCGNGIILVQMYNTKGEYERLGYINYDHLIRPRETISYGKVTKSAYCRYRCTTHSSSYEYLTKGTTVRINSQLYKKGSDDYTWFACYGESNLINPVGYGYRIYAVGWIRYIDFDFI